MKTLIITLGLIIASPALASSQELTCTSESGNVLEFSEKFGELMITDKDGNELSSQDALELGQSRVIETYPSIAVTDIVFSDDQDTVYAEIQEFEDGSKQVVKGDVAYACQAK